MVNQYKAEIILTGTELLMGELSDANAAFMASELRLQGIEVTRITIAGDDKTQLCQVLKHAIERSSLVLTSGGLGPTAGDMTRDCLAEVLGEKLAVDAELEKQLRALFARLHRDMPAANIKQATLIPSAQSIPNDRGTAPGWWVEKGGKIIVTLPGPPRELQQMWEKEVKPRLQKRFPGEIILTRTLKTLGFAEARVAEIAKPLVGLGNPYLGIYAKSDGIHLRLIARGENAGELLNNAEQQLDKIFAGSIWGKDEDSLPALIGRLLTNKKLTIATMEDGTHGLLASMITSSDGCRAYFKGGLVAFRGTPTVNAEIAEGMAIAARDKFSADIGLSTTAIAGLDSAEQGIPGLAYIGLADARGALSWEQRNLPYRDEARSRMAVAAMFRLREKLVEA